MSVMAVELMLPVAACAMMDCLPVKSVQVQFYVLFKCLYLVLQLRKPNMCACIIGTCTNVNITTFCQECIKYTFLLSYYTEPLYGATVLLESSMHNVMATVIPPTPVVPTADILNYQLSISGPLEDQEYTLSEDMRYIASCLLLILYKYIYICIYMHS